MPNFLRKITKKLAFDVAIDLGTTNTVIFMKGSGIVVNEPSLIAVKETIYGTNHVLSGSDVKKLLLGHYPGRLLVRKPIRCGEVADFTAAREMLVQYLERIRPWIPRSLRVLANIPSTASESQKATILKLLHAAGAKETYLVEEPRAIAIGAGLDLSDDKGNMIVDIGGGITEMSLLAGGHVVSARSIPVGGEHIDQAIAWHIRSKYNLNIDAPAAEQVKIRLGDAFTPGNNSRLPVEGYDIVRKRRGFAHVSCHEICDVLSGTLKVIIHSIKDFLKTLSPDQSLDILDRGIVLTGGSALIPNLDLRLERELVFPFRKVKDPLTCLALGSGDALEYLNFFE